MALKTYEEQLDEMSAARLSLANKYAAFRKAYGKAKSEIDLVYAAYIPKLMDVKKNMGYETGLLMLMNQKPEVADLYKTMTENLNNYKAVERMIDAHDSRIMAIQSIMRYNRVNDGGDN